MLVVLHLCDEKTKLESTKGAACLEMLIGIRVVLPTYSENVNSPFQLAVKKKCISKF